MLACSSEVAVSRMSRCSFSKLQDASRSAINACKKFAFLDVRLNQKGNIESWHYNSSWSVDWETDTPLSISCFSISGFSPHALAMLANASVQACFWMRPLLGKAPRLQLALKGHSLDQWHENGTEKSNLPSFCSWSALCGLLLPGLLPDQSKRFRLFRCLCWGSKVSC